MAHTLSSVVFRAIHYLLLKNKKKNEEMGTEIYTEELWNHLRNVLRGTEINEHPLSFDTAEYDIVSKADIIGILKEIFQATPIRNYGIMSGESIRGWKIDLNIFKKQEKEYNKSLQAEVAIDTNRYINIPREFSGFQASSKNLKKFSKRSKSRKSLA